MSVLPIHDNFYFPPLQDEQKCIETVELESYDKCQEVRALLKKKNRFILIRSPGKKVGLPFSSPSILLIPK